MNHLNIYIRSYGQLLRTIFETVKIYLQLNKHSYSDIQASMKCFIAGTLKAAESGFARIESIKPGDVVLSTNVDTMEIGYKKVLEKYVRKTKELVHIITGGET